MSWLYNKQDAYTGIYAEGVMLVVIIPEIAYLLGSYLRSYQKLLSENAMTRGRYISDLHAIQGY